MMNTMVKKSPNLVIPIPGRNNEARHEEVDNENGIIYPPEYLVASPIPIDEPNSLPSPLVSAVLVEEHHIHSAEEKRSRFDPFRPIHPRCNHISYGCLTMVFLVFVGMAVLLKTYLPDILPPSNDNVVIPPIDNQDLKSYDSYQPSPYLATEPLSKVSSNPSPRPTVSRSNPPSISTEPPPSPSFLPTVTRSNPPSMYPSHPPSIAIYEEKRLVASDGRYHDMFGYSCSMSKELAVIGAWGVDGEHNDEGAAYMFHLDGTEVKKLTPGDDGKDYDGFGVSVSIDEKVVVGSIRGNYVKVFSRDGIYERTIRCDECSSFGDDVATHGNLIVTSGKQNSIWKLFIYTTEGQLLKKIEQGSEWILDVAMSEKYIVTTGETETLIYSNTSPEFPKTAEINQGGLEVALSNERLVIGDERANNYHGAAWLYKTDGTLVKTLDSSSGSLFGDSVSITNDKVLVSASHDDGGGIDSGSVFIYYAVTGENIEKVVAPDAQAYDKFGISVCTSDSYFIVGASGIAAYLFQFSED